jgi:predicted RNA binding protein YcfA (HicA-like mRNA interferase family)
MSKIPSLSYTRIIRVLQKEGWIIVRQKGSHIRLQKRLEDNTLKITIPAHNPVKISTLSHILKQAGINIDRFLSLL